MIRDWWRSRVELLGALGRERARSKKLTSELAEARGDLDVLDNKYVDTRRALRLTVEKWNKALVELAKVQPAASAPLTGAFVDVNDVLNERARANALEARLAVLQEANMAANAELATIRRELDLKGFTVDV
jgi:hypothetical protein